MNTCQWERIYLYTRFERFWHWAQAGLIVFWQLTTGDWKHYVPTTRKLMAVARYYAYGIFKGEHHPVPKSERNKHNPLQRLTYLGISLVLIPLQVATGLLYYTYSSWPQWGIQIKLSTIAVVHMAGAFGLLAFLIVHIYMTTTGHNLTCHLKAMCTGWEEVPANGSPRAEQLDEAA